MTIYTGNCTETIDGNFADTLSSLVKRLQRWAEVQQLKINVRRERQQLLEMSDAMLGDLGITRAQAQEEARKVNLPEARFQMLDREVC